MRRRLEDYLLGLLLTLLAAAWLWAGMCKQIQKYTAFNYVYPGLEFTDAAAVQSYYPVRVQFVFEPGTANLIDPFGQQIILDDGRAKLHFQW